MIIVADYNPFSSNRKTHDGASVGLDFGLKTYLTASDGSKIDSPLFWKLAHELCKKYDFIFLETLNIEAMKRLWGKKISDLSHSSFVDKLEYIATKYGVTVHHIDKWYPSSKTCECGYVNKNLSLKDRTWVCSRCGSVNDRDLLAAQNILRKGISELESMGNSSSRNTGVPCVCIQESHAL